MSGRLRDATFVSAWLVAFVVVAMVHPGLANAVIAWMGAMSLGYYNSLVRHNPKDDSLRPAWRRTVPAEPQPSASPTA